MTLQPPPRADLRLPVRHATDPTRCSTSRPHVPAAHRTGTSSPTSWPSSGPTGTRVVATQRALGGVRAVRRPLAVRGAPRTRTGRSPTCRPSGGRPRRPSSGIYLELLRRFDSLLRRRRCPTSPAWHQAPRAGRPPPRLPAPASCSRIQRAPDKLKYLAGSESGMGAFVNDMHAGAGRRDAARRAAAMTTGARSVVDALRVAYGDAPEGVWSAPGPGQPDRRAHRLQRRLRAAVRDRGPRRSSPRAGAATTCCGCGRSRHRTRHDAFNLGRAGSRATAGGWSAYVAGVVWAAREAGHDVSVAWTFWSTAECRSAAGSRRRHALECATAAAATDLYGTLSRLRTTWPALSLSAPRTTSSARRPG